MNAKATLEQPRRKRAPYVGWRAEELAKLALSGVPSWSVTDITEGGKFDYAVMDVNSGTSFMVEVKSLSSIHSNRKIDPSASEIPIQVAASLVKSAQAMHCPVFLFVFDVDTDHGRFRRLDLFDIADVHGEKFWLYLPISNVINAQSMQKLAKELSAG